MRPSPFHHHPHPHRASSSHHVPQSSQSHAEIVTLPGGGSTSIEPSAVSKKSVDVNARHITHRHDAYASDIERESLPQYTSHNDPFNLESRKVGDSELAAIRANTSKKRDGISIGPLALSKGGRKAQKIHDFYETQNENIDRLLKPVEDHTEDARKSDEENHLQYKIAVTGSFVANVVLAGLQLYGAASSGSLSLFTTMADSLFDPLSNVTLILCNRAVKRVDPRKFPSGKARIETAGNIFFCFLMVSVSLIIIVMSIRELVEGSKTATNGFHLPSVIAVAVAFCTKLGLFFYCWALRNTYSQIRILWEDHRNDLFINGFGILTSVGGSKLRWWIDPMGAIILSLLIICLWLRTAWSEFQLLIGVSADTSMLQHITYISMTHSPEIRAIDTVRAYHSGPRLIVEVDIVMEPEETLKRTHDVAEDLQKKLESLPDVERAYVHVDYDTDHPPEHFVVKKDV
ncbi:hypothetical protein EJ05DRAFT_440626 [Pseudovirgaria hyperparasitica]|uniref:Uncharacterized protein n=1 Tax=Pseudovirgaria hyperparasitica TaxID=470096 RepID=A0A6A6W7U7_9PEZI|nr:uncharacterized protein EJ05DRAFT_440626 [Pseudovirgaria hyperparasitica]KAF2757151.1 hypothetical protein EJ05DRAFT_440626 [Pseudovirgaria hyperparasitica]